jgi:hypothetical protein
MLPRSRVPRCSACRDARSVKSKRPVDAPHAREIRLAGAPVGRALPHAPRTSIPVKRARKSFPGVASLGAC